MARTFAPSRAQTVRPRPLLPSPGRSSERAGGGRRPCRRDDPPWSRHRRRALRPFAQFRLEDLAVIVLRQAIDEAVFLRPLEARRCREAELLEAAHRAPDPAGAPRKRPRARPLRIRHTDDGNFRDGVMQRQDLLHLARIDVAAAGDDHVLGAVLEREVAVRVERSEMAVQPAAAQGLRRRLRIAPVALHQRLSPRARISPVSPRAAAGRRVDGARHDHGLRQPRRAEAVVAACAIGLSISARLMPVPSSSAIRLAVELASLKPSLPIAALRSATYIGAPPKTIARSLSTGALRNGWMIDEPLHHRRCGEHRRLRPPGDQPRKSPPDRNARSRESPALLACATCGIM